MQNQQLSLLFEQPCIRDQLKQLNLDFGDEMADIPLQLKSDSDNSLEPSTSAGYPISMCEGQSKPEEQFCQLLAFHRLQTECHFDNDVPKQETSMNNSGSLMLRKKPQNKNETKNIPKNFGKQIIKFIKCNQEIVQTILFNYQSPINYGQLASQMKQRKKTMNKIGDLKSLWNEESVCGKEMRIISLLFLRKYCHSWIFNSRVVDFQPHLKYRKVLSFLVGRPQQFAYLKTSG